MKAALSATRAIEVLDYLTVRPLTAFTLTELAVALNVSRASLLAVLVPLTESGYLVRHPRHKTYGLGPAPLALGYAASVRHPIVELARPEMIRLAEYGHECAASAVAGEDIVVVAVEGRASGTGRARVVGDRLPMLPPFGQATHAWSTPIAVRKWLDRLGPDTPDDLIRTLERSLVAVRSRGFALALQSDQVDAVQELVHDIQRQPWNAELQERLRTTIPRQVADYTLETIDPAGSYSVNNMSAPVFGPDGAAVCVLTISGIHEVTGARVLEIGRELAAASRTLTRELGGQVEKASAGVAN